MMKQQHSDSVALADFFGLFLQTRFPAPGAAVEMAYNIVGMLLLTSALQPSPHMTNVRLHCHRFPKPA